MTPIEKGLGLPLDTEGEEVSHTVGWKVTHCAKGWYHERAPEWSSVSRQPTKMPKEEEATFGPHLEPTPDYITSGRRCPFPLLIPCLPGGLDSADVSDEEGEKTRSMSPFPLQEM